MTPHIPTAGVRTISFVLLSAALVPVLAHAQSSPFDAGATGAVAFALRIATPAAILAVIVAGGAALVGRISWGWAIGGILGIAIMFGAPQIVAWVRGMFGV